MTRTACTSDSKIITQQNPTGERGEFLFISVLAAG